MQGVYMFEHIKKLVYRNKAWYCII